ncbi:MAG TPA: hypothetical protein DEW18_03870 [Ruminococcaceae bacterium]|nr:hypothetical protein [Oscillospiraceae bacterium]
MNKRILALLLAVGMILLLAAGCGDQGKGKILSTEGVPQEVLQSALYKAALEEETATVIAYNSVPLTDSAPLRAAVEKMQTGEDAVLTYYEINADGRCWAWRLTMKDGVASYQSTRTEDWNSAIDWESVLYRQAGEIKLNSCGYLSFGEEGPAYAPLYWVFSPLDPYDGYNERYELTKTYLKPLWAQGGAQFGKPEDITDPWTWMFFYDGMTGEYEGYHEGGTMPTQEVVNLLVSRFEISEQKLRSLLDPDGDGSIEWIKHGGIAPQYFAKEAVQEGDLLRIRFGLLPDSDGSEPIYDRELTVRLAEDGSWKYVSNRTVPAELENGVTAMSIDGMLSGSGWQPLYTSFVPEGDGYNQVFHTTMEPKLLADGTMAIPVIPKTGYKDGAPIAVMMLHTDGSYEVIKTPLTCGDWLRTEYDAGKAIDTDTEATEQSIIIRTTYSDDVGVGFSYYEPTRVVETEVWADGRVESRDYVPEGSRYSMRKSPDGQHIADKAGNGSLTIDGVTVIETGLDRTIWEYDDYYRPELWLDNDRLVISSNYYRYCQDYGIYSLSTGEVVWLGAMRNNQYGLGSISLLDGKLCWTAISAFKYDDEGNLLSEKVFCSIPIEELPYGTPTCAVTELYYIYTDKYKDGRLWSVNTDYNEPAKFFIKAFEPATGKSAETELPVAEWLDGGDQSRSWSCVAYKMTEQGMVLHGTQYMENDNYGIDWFILVPNELLNKMEWQQLPSVLDSAEEIPLTEIEEIFGGRWLWTDTDTDTQYELTLYRQGDALYFRWADAEPQELVSAKKTGTTAYYIATRRANSTTDALVLDTGKPKDNKISALFHGWHTLTYQGEA